MRVADVSEKVLSEIEGTLRNKKIKSSSHENG